MNKTLKIILIIIACVVGIAIIGGTIAFVITGNMVNSDEYKVGDDSIKSIKAVVGKRDVTSTSTGIDNKIQTKSIKYKSDSVQDDVLKYVEYLRGEGGFTLTKNANLSVIPSSIELAKKSNEEGKIIRLIINYDFYEYTITIQKGKGTLTLY